MELWVDEHSWPVVDVRRARKQQQDVYRQLSFGSLLYSRRYSDEYINFPTS